MTCFLIYCAKIGYGITENKHLFNFIFLFCSYSEVHTSSDYSGSLGGVFTAMVGTTKKGLDCVSVTGRQKILLAKMQNLAYQYNKLNHN